MIDTHCHLDSAAFDADRDAVITRATQAGVRQIVIPAVNRANFLAVQKLAHAFEGGRYALGIHPMCVPEATEHDLLALDDLLADAMNDPRFVAIGEIGLDFFIPELRTPAMQAKQEAFYIAQLDMAVRYRLPVLLHVRRSQDLLLKQLRRKNHAGGIAHAFNGSFQQAGHFLDQGFALGVGGAMTFPRALQIRRLASQLPLQSLVLETDAPDIPPAWLATGARNEPAEVAQIARTLASLRGVAWQELVKQTSANARRYLPRLNT